MKGSGNLYVQFASEGDGGLWGEVVSNQFLDDQERLTPEIEDRIVELGWHPPETFYAPGSETGRVNYYREWPAPADLRSAACLAAVTLRTAFGVNEPNQVSVEVEQHEAHD